MQQERIYGIIEFAKIDKAKIEAHIKEFEIFEEAVLFPNISFIVIKKRQGGENIPGTGLFFPNVYTYKIVDVNNQQYFIEYGHARVSDYIIKTKRFAYYDHIGSGEIAIFDRCGEIDAIELNAEFDYSIGVIKNLIEFLIDFECNYNSDWKLYRIKIDLLKKIENLEKELTNANSKASDLTKKLKEVRRKLKEFKSS